MYPCNKNYNAESGLNAKEIEMGTTAESLELRFRLYLYLIFLCKLPFLKHPVEKWIFLKVFPLCVKCI